MYYSINSLPMSSVRVGAGVAAAVEQAIADLRYGSVVILHWGLLAYYMKITPGVHIQEANFTISNRESDL